VADTFNLVRMGVTKGAKLCGINAPISTLAEVIESLPENERPMLKVARAESGRVSKVTMTLPGVAVPMPLKLLSLQSEIYLGIASGDFDSRNAFKTGGEVDGIVHALFPTGVTFSGRPDKSMRFKGGTVTIVAPMHQGQLVQQQVNAPYTRCEQEKVLGGRVNGKEIKYVLAHSDKLKATAVDLGVLHEDDGALRSCDTVGSAQRRRRAEENVSRG
jgi:hypothetical protein